jgi:hypothetical protein
MPCEFNSWPPEEIEARRSGGEREESVHPVLVVGGPSEEPVTAAKGRPNRTAVASLPPSVFTNVSMQNGFLSLSRPRRKKPSHGWCLIPRV